MSTIRLIMLLLISLPFDCFSNTYYGILRGNQQVIFKGVLPGVLFFSDTDKERIKKPGAPFEIKSYEYISKLRNLKLKIENEERKQKELTKSLKMAKVGLDKGFISKNEFDEIRNKTSELSIYIIELKDEMKNIEFMLSLNTPIIKSDYIIRDYYANSGDFIKPGDSIIKLELLDSYHIDIKYDPSSIVGNIKDKTIKIKSLVNNAQTKATVSNIHPAENTNNVFGLKVADLIVESCDYDFSELLDTTFEITVND